MWSAFPWVPQPMEVPLPSFPSCMISRTKHTLPLELSCSQSGLFNTNQLKLTGRFHCCLGSRHTRISIPAGRPPELEWQGCHILSHCSDIREGCECASLESWGCHGLLCADDLSTLDPAPPTASLQQPQLQNHQTGNAPGCLTLAGRGSVPVLLVSLS